MNIHQHAFWDESATDPGADAIPCPRLMATPGHVLVGDGSAIGETAGRCPMVDDSRLDRRNMWKRMGLADSTRAGRCPASPVRNDWPGLAFGYRRVRMRTVWLVALMLGTVPMCGCSSIGESPDGGSPNAGHAVRGVYVGGSGGYGVH